MKKDLNILQGPYGFYVKFKGGGVVPTVLKGHFTSMERAKYAVDTYVSNKPTKKTNDAYKHTKPRAK